jgi:hypothetical protein
MRRLVAAGHEVRKQWSLSAMQWADTLLLVLQGNRAHMLLTMPTPAQWCLVWLLDSLQSG